MEGVAGDGREFTVRDRGQEWRVGWHPPPDAPPGRPHGAAAVCVYDGRVVLVSADGLGWGIPGGRPEPGEGWAETLRREVAEEACAAVLDARLLGFSRGTCVRGPQRGLVLVRSMWRAEVRPAAWRPRFEMAHRKLAPPGAALDAVIAAEPDMGPVYRRMFAEAAVVPPYPEDPHRA